eukprot:CAMPEP_0194764610 /NCGR_PEP_ID=MMETSP0323_2-20130528/23518_1 /TAXON_ID=2866 ORGANISM="Crypthecodinium cohnii, Strain Seligo" /NCGR_SAMPLE_ID=MMETSP0323_2 /ASSEMBLY_ACC=CAM_ASM_000346 /LENGTH=93 /DNA_ID=CAMNT_0039692243 /DNA_START=96 /DNA_END=377 /DNA_ORIENTATION=-
MAGMREAMRLIAQPSPQRTAITWAITIIVAGKWIWDSEQENPHWFSERPTIFGTPQASQMDLDELMKNNENIVDKDHQVRWKASKSDGTNPRA